MPTHGALFTNPFGKEAGGKPQSKSPRTRNVVLLRQQRVNGERIM